MNFLILGPVEVRGRDGVVELLPRRQRVVLSMLLLQANTVVPIEHLIDALWDGEVPTTARSQVQICISQLRQLLAGMGLHDIISTRPPGYLVRLENGQLDLLEFERRVEEGRQALKEKRFQDGAALIRSALGLWRGEPMAGANSSRLESAGVYLRERHVAVLEECIDAELRINRHQELIGELRTLIAKHPYRERLRGQLMLSLYRSGRQADALEHYQSARQLFADELALEPGLMLQGLERSILTKDPALDVHDSGMAYSRALSLEPAPVVPRLLPAAIGDFTGREDVIGELLGRLRPGPEAIGRFVMPLEVITGSGGIGKTALAVQLAHLLEDDYPDGQLYADLRHSDVSSALSSFLRALGVSGREIPNDVNAMAGMFRDRLAGRRVLVVLDNAVSEDQATRLLPGSPTCATIITSRVRLTGLPGARHTTLRIFDEQQSLAFMTKVLAYDDRLLDLYAMSSLARLCDGLPLALRIASARLAAHPHWPAAHLENRLKEEDDRLDELVHGSLDLRDNIAVSYQGLAPSARMLFRRLSLCDATGFEGWVAASLLDRPYGKAVGVLDGLVHTHLVEVQRLAGQPPRFRLHDLIRAYARERLASEETEAEQRQALRRLLCGWLSLAEQAHHAEFGGAHPLLTGDAPRWPLPADVVESIITEPLEWFERERHCLARAVTQAATHGEDELSWQLAMPMITLYESRGGFDEWSETHLAALDATVRAGNRRGETAMRYSLGALHVHSENFARARQWLEEALAIFVELGEVHGRALALRYQAYLARISGSFEVARADYQEALGLLRSVGDRVGESHVLTSLAQIELNLGRLDESADLLAQALAVADPIGNRRLIAQIHHRLGELALRRQRHEEAAARFAVALETVRRTGDRAGEAYALHGIGLVHLAEGRLDLAEDVLTTALVGARRSGQRVLGARTQVALADVQQRSGRPESAAWNLVTALRTFARADAAPWQVITLRKLRELRGENPSDGIRQALAAAVLGVTADSTAEVREAAADLA